MDDKCGFLQVEAFGSVVGGNQHLARLFELSDHGVIGVAVVGRGSVLAGKKIQEHLLGFHALGEDNRLPSSSGFLHQRKTMFEDSQQFPSLGILGDALAHGQHLPPLVQFFRCVLHPLEPFDNPFDGLQNCCRRGTQQAQQPQGEVILVHFRKGFLFRLVNVGIQQVIQLSFCLAGSVFYGQQHTPRHLGVVLGLGTEGTEAIPADLLTEFRVVLRSA